jgi:hypothetical protein
MELGNNNVVKLRNGLHGIVASFNGKPIQIIFKSYNSTLDKYDENLKHKSSNFDIVGVYDGSSVDNVKKVFSKKFNEEELECLWKETE